MGWIRAHLATSKAAHVWQGTMQLLCSKVSQLWSQQPTKQEVDRTTDTSTPTEDNTMPTGCFSCLIKPRKTSLGRASSPGSKGCSSAAPPKVAIQLLPSCASSISSTGASIPAFQGDSASSKLSTPTCVAMHCQAQAAAAADINLGVLAGGEVAAVEADRAAADKVVKEHVLQAASASDGEHPPSQAHCQEVAADSPPKEQQQQQQSVGQQPPLLQQLQQQQQPFWEGSWSFGFHTEQNQRVHMEDRLKAVDLTGHTALAGAKRAGFFAVYDGHAGHETAQYLESNLLSYVLEAGPEALASTPLDVLGNAVQQVELELVRSCAEGSCSSGSTVCAMLMVDDKLHVANVGDSRAVLGRGADASQLTRDHKPACRVEAARIKVDDPCAEVSSDGYMYGELGVARAIGSAHLKRDPSKRALIPTPELSSIQLQPEDDFVMLATDGVWDKVENKEAVIVARRTLANSKDATAAACALVERAKQRDSSDNISVVMLLLHGRTITLPKSNSRLFRRAQMPAGDSPAAAGSADSISSVSSSSIHSSTSTQN